MCAERHKKEVGFGPLLLPWRLHPDAAAAVRQRGVGRWKGERGGSYSRKKRQVREKKTTTPNMHKVHHG